MRESITSRDVFYFIQKKKEAEIQLISGHKIYLRPPAQMRSI